MPLPPILDLYLNRIREVRALGAGTPETSYYPAIQLALDATGNALWPRILCLHHPSGTAGIPDFGLFEAPRTRAGSPPAWSAGTNPDRGVVKVKGTKHNIEALIQKEQVRTRYIPHYHLVLVTNLWQFRLLRHGTGIIETFDLAPDEPAFWSLVHGLHPKPLQTRFADFLERCLQHPIPQPIPQPPLRRRHIPPQNPSPPAQHPLPILPSPRLRGEPEGGQPHQPHHLRSPAHLPPSAAKSPPPPPPVCP